MVKHLVLVCQGSGKYIPPNANQNCNSTVDVSCNIESNDTIRSNTR